MNNKEKSDLLKSLSDDHEFREKIIDEILSSPYVFTKLIKGINEALENGQILRTGQ